MRPPRAQREKHRASGEADGQNGECAYKTLSYRVQPLPYRKLPPPGYPLCRSFRGR
ncbi:hypothetical protein AA14362_0342 [Acetobacter cerevisiae DSM 14362]|nr:hypothetical protein AA14362_0342 [Acetobacter cerevisiae DSM 14362]